MSTCPSHDIHSMYIDDELPEPYKSKYKEHVSECLQCSKTLQTLKSIHEELSNDAKDITFSQKEIDESFQRLQTKMRFANVTKVTQKSNHSINFFAYRILPAVAAALIIAVVLPLRLFTASSVSPSSTIPLLSAHDKALQASFIEEKGIVRDANLNHYSLDVSSIQLTSMDLFRPELSDDGKMKISITLTGVANLPISKTDKIDSFDNFIDMKGFVPVDFKTEKYN